MESSRLTQCIVTSLGILLAAGAVSDKAEATISKHTDDGNGFTAGGDTAAGSEDLHPPLFDGPDNNYDQSRDHGTHIQEPVFTSCSNQQESAVDRFVMLVSTLDGKVSALNGQNGQMQWSLSTGTGPLLSSSISELVLSSDGRPARLIPSLDGNLYRLNSDGLEPVPLSAEILLSSSFRLSDDSMVVGGKDIESYGINLSTGKVMYTCSLAGCRTFDHSHATGASTVDNDVLVIKRIGRTVRAVDILTGNEKWNYSVAQHDITFITQPCKMPTVTMSIEQSSTEFDNSPSIEQIRRGSHEENCGADDSTGHCDVQTEDVDVEGEPESGFIWTAKKDEVIFDPADVDLKVVPTGTLRAMSRSDPGRMYWERKLGVGIASTWVLQEKQLSEISLFDNRHIPALNQYISGGSGRDRDDIPVDEIADDESMSTNSLTPLIYIGQYNDHLYVMPSVSFQQQMEIAGSSGQAGGSDSTTSVAVRMPRIRWRPYISTAPSRTPVVTNSLIIPGRGERNEEESSETAVTPAGVLESCDQYPFDTGYWMQDTRFRLPDASKTIPVAQNSSLEHDDFSVSLLNWWKEVTVISIVTSIVVHLFLVKYVYKRHAEKCSAHLSATTATGLQNDEELASKTADVSPTIGNLDNKTPAAEVKTTEYVSRYLTDFEQKACLGRGGFGVVFCAHNRLDDCEYAIKRIALNDSDTAREKVMREVKALAKLDHNGIVRYYQSWFECPPPGWQEEKDKFYIDMSLNSPSQAVTPTVHSMRRSSTDVGRQKNGVESRSVNPLRPFDLFSTSFGSPESVDNRSTNKGNDINQHEINIESSSEDSDDDDDDILQHGDNSDNSNSIDSGFSPLRHAAVMSVNPAGIFRDCSSNDSYEISFRNDVNTDAVASSSLSVLSTSEDSCSGADTSPARTIADIGDSFSVVFTSGATDKPKINKSFDSRSGSTTSQLRNELKKVKFGTWTVSNSTPSRRPDSLFIPESEGSLQNVGSGDGAKSSASRKLYLYIQMQLCQPESLKDWLNNNTLNRDKRQLVNVFHQIVSAINYVHTCGLMHRDLKPSNIFFAMNGSVKIGDFGLVTAVEENCDMCNMSSEGLTSPACVIRRHTDQVGTQLYMSPEQFSGHAYTYKVDIYALGMIFFELFFPFPTQMERIETLRDVRKLIFPQRFVRELSMEYEFVKMLLSHDPDLRPSTDEMLKHSLLAEFEESSQACLRLQHSLSRQRTISWSGSANNPSPKISLSE